MLRHLRDLEHLFMRKLRIYVYIFVWIIYHYIMYLCVLYIIILCINMYYISLFMYLCVLYIIILCIYMYYISLYYVFICIIWFLHFCILGSIDSEQQQQQDQSSTDTLSEKLTREKKVDYSTVSSTYYIWLCFIEKQNEIDKLTRETK